MSDGEQRPESKASTSGVEPARGAVCAGGLAMAGAIGITALARHRRAVTALLPRFPVRRLLPAARARHTVIVVSAVPHGPVCATGTCFAGCAC